MRTNLRLPACTIGLMLAQCVALATPAGGRENPSSHYVQRVADGEASPASTPQVRGRRGWWGTAWTEAEGAGFFGMPAPATGALGDDTDILIRYTRYVTDYDAEFHAPLWGAYTLDRDAVATDTSGERSASNPDFGRPPQLFREPLIVQFSRVLGVPTASHGAFTGAVDPRFPILVAGMEGATAEEVRAARSGRAIQRGPMVPAIAMRSQGSYEEGQVAQLESFSVANIVPQFARSVAPSWSSLEDACFDWASELGRVWLFVGPVFRHRDHPSFIQKLRGGAPQIIPVPDELFYVVIGRRGGRISAVGFLVPHVPEFIDYKTKVVPVRRIEAAVGLNFMPELGPNDEVETSFDPAWLATPTRPKARSASREYE